MNIYLKWTDSYLSDHPNISVFDLKIIQEENCFAKARLVIDALTSLPPTGTEGMVWEEKEHLLFKGHLMGSLVKLEGAFGEIELIAKPLNFLEKIRTLQETNRTHPYWDGLWVPPNKQENVEEMQDVRTASLYCDSRTGELSLSDWFVGRKTIPLTQHFFHQSLSLKIIRTPLQACTIHVHVHWIQWMRGISNLSSQIRKAFPHRKVNSYTGQAILEKWPEARNRLGRSGLWILKSELKPMSPSSALYPAYSPPLPLEDKGTLKNYRLKRHWFKPILWVRWQVRQKRRETLSLTLPHDFQPLFPGEGEHKTVEFTLQNINPDPEAYAWQPQYFYRQAAKITHQNAVYTCKADHYSALTFEEDQELWIFKKRFHTPLGNPARASFFLTDRGIQAAEHAMERAKVILARSARCLEVSFEGAWDELKEITTDASVLLVDPRLPGGEVTGKVVKHALIAKGETGERIGRITLLCAAGTGKEDGVESTPTPTYSLDDYGETRYQVYENQVCQTPTGLSYFTYDTQGQPEYIRTGPLLRGIQLTNGPKEQEDNMRQHHYKSPAALQKALAQKPTRLRLFFKDLRTKERLEHLIPVRMATRWSAPRQFTVN